MRQFLGKVCKYPQLNEILTPHLNNLSSFMAANESYANIDQITVDFNLVEVGVFILLDSTVMKVIPNKFRI